MMMMMIIIIIIIIIIRGDTGRTDEEVKKAPARGGAGAISSVRDGGERPYRTYIIYIKI